MKKHISLLLFLLIGISTFGQKVVTTVDTTRNKIGAQFNLTLTVTADTSATVKFPAADSFGQLQLIRSYVIDTVRKEQQYELIKKYGLTQFDSGRYTIPRLPVLINNKRFYSDSLQVEVANVVVDTLKQKMFEIKPIIEARADNSSWWLYLLFGLLIAALGYLAYRLFRKYRKPGQEQFIYKSPIEKATSLLKNLENKQLWQRGEIKSYYSELTDIARSYIEEEIHIPAMESTTTELIQALRRVSSQKKMQLSKETLADLEQVLMQADLVKFAKSRPVEYEIEQDKKRIEKTIVLIHKAVPEEIEDEDDNMMAELLHEKKRKQKRKKRIRIAIASVVLAVFATVSVLIAVKGFDYVKDLVLGNETKELLESQWVSSEYGNPGVFVETPAVLKRTDLSSMLPKEGLALIREMQSFVYGELMGDFYIMVSTLGYKQDMPADLAKSIESGLQTLETKGAHNMIVKQEEFSTPEGLSGRKGYGTFSKIDAVNKTSDKYYYELLLFGQQNGLQQILIVYREGDKYAAQIAERILNSVELKKANP